MGRRPWGPWRTLPCPWATREDAEAPAWPRVGPRVGGCVMPIICHPALGQPATRVAGRIDGTMTFCDGVLCFSWGKRLLFISYITTLLFIGC